MGNGDLGIEVKSRVRKGTLDLSLSSCNTKKKLLGICSFCPSSLSPSFFLSFSFSLSLSLSPSLPPSSFYGKIVCAPSCVIVEEIIIYIYNYRLAPPIHSVSAFPESYQYTYGAADPLSILFILTIVVVVHDIAREFVFEVGEVPGKGRRAFLLCFLYPKLGILPQ